MTSDQVPYDPTRPYTGRSSVWNQGCPPGTFCEWVPLSTPGAADIGNPDYGVVCRWLTAAPSDADLADALVADAGWAWDTAVAEQSMDAYNAALAESGQWSWWVWAALALVGIIAWRGGSSEAPAWLGHRRGKLL